MAAAILGRPMKLARAMTFALPLSMALWGLLFVVARDSMPTGYRHVIDADLHYALSRVRPAVVSRREV